jgi:hypothetical protein
MNVEPIFKGIPWRDYLQECLMYLVIMGLAYFIVFVIGCLIVAALPRRDPGICRRRIGHLGLFLIVLLAVSALANGLWSCLIYNRLYHSSDYVFDFLPFVPVTMNADPPRVEGFGTTSIELNAVWCAFATFTWVVTIALYRVIAQRMAKRHLLRTLFK